jgi:hypothetical protein
MIKIKLSGHEYSQEEYDMEHLRFICGYYHRNMEESLTFAREGNFRGALSCYIFTLSGLNTLVISNETKDRNSLTYHLFRTVKNILVRRGLEELLPLIPQSEKNKWNPLLLPQEEEK